MKKYDENEYNDDTITGGRSSEVHDRVREH